MEQTIEKLLHQEFSRKARGYDRDQVDDFLDEIIEDIERLQKKYELLLEEKKILEKNNFELKMKMLSMQEKMNTQAAVTHTTMLGETKLVTPQEEASFNRAPQPQRREEPARRVHIATQNPVYAEQTQTFENPRGNGMRSNSINTNQEFNPVYGQPLTHEDSNADDHTLQDRIDQLERELNDIKNFSD